MPGPRPAAHSRPMGGMGHFGEGMDENALQQAVQQQASQQGTTLPTGGAGAGSPLASPGAQPAAPRELGTLQEELITRPAKDVVEGLKSIFDLKAALGIESPSDDPQTKAKKQQMLQRFNQLNSEQQAIAQQEYQQRMQEKQKAEQEAAARAEQKRQQEAQTLNMPSSPQKGAQNPGGSKKQQATQRLQQDRKTLSNAKGAN